MLEQVINIISEYQGVDPKTINENSLLINDVGLSSFDVMSIVCNMEDTFNIEFPDRKIREFKTVKDVVEFIENNTKKE